MTTPLFCLENRISVNNMGIIEDITEDIIENITKNIPKPDIFIRFSDIMVIDNTLTTHECDTILELNSAFKSGQKREKMCINSPQLTALLQKRLEEFIPGSIYKENQDIYLFPKNNQDHKYWIKPEINPDFRLVKCNPHSPMSAHYDGVLVKNVDYKSIYTLMIYLSDNEDGGANFLDKNLVILPKKGRLCVFDQALLHEGLGNSTEKYILRSEILYHRETPIETETDKYAMELLNQAKLLYKTDKQRACQLEQDAFTISPNLENAVLNI